MKIIHVITAFGIGGAEKLLLNVINKQVLEHEVHLIYLKPVDDLIPLVDKKVNKKYVPLSISIIKELKNYYKKIEPDVIHTHLGHADLLGIWSARKTSAKIFCTIHSTFFKNNNIDIFYFHLYRLMFRYIQRIQVISISKSVEKLILERFKVPVQRCHLLYNAIPSKHLNFSTNNSNKIKLLFVGRLTKAKSLNTLLKAVHYISNDKVELTIVGDGELKVELEQLVRKLNINSQVLFVGKQSNTDIYYENADIFVLPSIWEGFGIVILEAFRAKLAVIATNIEGPAELIQHNENGLLFEPTNYIQLANQLILLINNKNLRYELAQKGIETFTEKFQIDSYVEKLNYLYTEA